MADTTPLSHRPRAILVTGAAGRIGSYFAEHAPHQYALRLMVQGTESPESIEHLKPFGEVIRADLADVTHLRELCRGIDTVVHLAGNPAPSATWQQLLPNNIVGTYNIFAAAKFSGVRRFIYASSIHAVSGYPADVQVKVTEPVNPGDLYGVSKCFGEALGRYMAEQEGLSTICVRIAAFQPPEYAEKSDALRLVDALVSDRDLQQLFERAIEAESVQFAIVHGMSDNRFKRLDISNARTLLGYAPQDDATELTPALRPLHLRDATLNHNRTGDDQKSGLRETAASSDDVH